MNPFDSIRTAKTNSNTFNLSHDVKLTMNMGDLVPTQVLEVLPGDKFNLRQESFARFMPMISPVMHNVKMITHHFFVPYRLVWKNWQKFAEATNEPESAPALPYDNGFQSNVGDLADYLGLPVGKTMGNVNLFAFASYWLICNEYYRDQNLQTIPSRRFTLNDGKNVYFQDQNDLKLFKKAWGHDYFTSALPFAQKGDPVQLPLIGDAPIVLKGDVTGTEDSLLTQDGNIADFELKEADYSSSDRGKLFADLSNATSATINDLRNATKLQEYLEILARGGSRYVEILRSIWNVVPDDARMQRPEFIGGHKSNVVISEVLQTSSTDSASPLGQMAGHGLTATYGDQHSYYAKEHGLIISLTSILPDTSYMQGLHKMFQRKNPFDFPIPHFAHLGEQEIKNSEIYYDTGDGKNDDTFGYIPRYSEMRYVPSRVAGKLRTNMKHWTLVRDFANRPHLNGDFISANVRKDIFAVTDPNEHSIVCHFNNHTFVNRKLPKYGTPNL